MRVSFYGTRRSLTLFTRTLAGSAARFSTKPCLPVERTTLALARLRSLSEGPIRRSYCSGNLPSHVKITLPALSPTMETGTVVTWHKKEGEQLSEGDLLCEIETDKATMGFDAPEEGYLAKILIEAGSKDVPIGKLMCIIVENESDVASFKDFQGGESGVSSSTSSKTDKPEQSKSATSSASSSAHGDGKRVVMGPAVRLLLHHYNIEESDVKPSGPKGNLLKEDVMALVSAKQLKPTQHKAAPPKAVTATPQEQKAPAATKAPAAAAPARGGASYTDIPLSNIRAVIAKRLSQSKQTIPHQYMSASVKSDKMNALRKELKSKGIAVSVNDFIVKACASALRAVPEMNVQWKNDGVVPQSTVDVSVAVATPTGLITPIVFGADSIGLTEISQRIRTLAEKARNNKLQPQEFQGGTFTISNLGMFGSVTNFTAIINPPQAAILAVGGPQVEMNGDLEPETRFTITLCMDGRAIPDESARRFLALVSQSLSDPQLMLLSQPLDEPSDEEYARLL